MVLLEDIGSLQAVRLQAGSTSGWKPTDGIVVKTGGHYLRFKLGKRFFLDELPKLHAKFYGANGKSMPILSQVTLFADQMFFAGERKSEYMLHCDLGSHFAALDRISPLR